jgi:hypothetical protein
MRNMMRSVTFAVLACAALALSGCARRTGLELNIDLAGTLTPGKDFDTVKIIADPPGTVVEQALFKVDADTSFPVVVYVWGDTAKHQTANVLVELYQNGATKALHAERGLVFEDGEIVPISIVLSNQ